MAGFLEAVYSDEARRAEIRSHATLNGVDYVEVVTAPEADNQRVLNVHFIEADDPANTKVADLLADLDGNTSAVQIAGGVRIRDIRVTGVHRVGDYLQVRVDRPGDFSTYTLSVTHGSLDPFYTQVQFSFKAGCPSRFDCKPLLICPPEPVEPPLIDYMARDYASFRQLLIDQIPTLVPDWTERLEADLGITLVELMAYVGDELSYYQDAVANEAYLDTARQRISVRRHARLIDYHIHDGLSARTFLHVKLKDNQSGLLPRDSVLQALTRPGSVPRAIVPVIPDELAAPALAAADAVFEARTPWDVYLHARLNDIPIHDWGNREYCVPRGATSLDLVGDLAYDEALDAPGGPRAETWRLKKGDLLLLEETDSPVTGLPADADPSHRQVVRLTAVEAEQDPLPGGGAAPQLLTHIAWAAADALTFPLCVATQLRDGSYATGLSVARGNLLVADHGRTVDEWYPEQPTAPFESGIELGRRAFRFRLDQGPVSFVVARQAAERSEPASALRDADPRRAVPAVACVEAVYDESGTARTTDWEPVVPDLLASGSFDTHFVVEADNRQQALLRFGDNHFGRAPDDNAYLHITYRIGVGPAGNVGADALLHAIHNPDLPQMASVRNPLPAWGGTAPEPIERVKQIAPAAFRAEQYRAVTEADYAHAAEKHPQVDRAMATFRWTGSWHTVFVTIDPKGTSEVSADLETSVRDWVIRYTLAGYDLEIDGPIFVPLALELDVCVAPGYFRSDVESALLDALSSQVLPGGSRGFFHPDNFTFGQPLYLSKLVAAVTSVVGVEAVDVTRFARQHAYDPDPDRPATRRNLEQGSIAAGRLEIVRLDNDPNFPENGVLELKLRGGK